jgi:hypothetical protein
MLAKVIAMLVFIRLCATNAHFYLFYFFVETDAVKDLVEPKIVNLRV